MSGDDDQALVAAAQAGDRRALDDLLRRHYERVHAVCRRVTGSVRDADDAAQEAMISIVRGLPRFDGRSAFSTWIYRIATNAALDEVRRRNRRAGRHLVTVGDRVDEPGGTAEPADPAAQRRVEGVADRLAIERAVADLPEEFRVAVVLRDVGDLDYGEIAEVLGVPVGTVKSRIARGRGLLVTALRDPDTSSGSAGNPAGGPQRPSAARTDADRAGETGPAPP